MHVSQKCIDLVKSFEGFSAKAYLCPAKIWTIGYGSTRIYGRPVKQTDVITKDIAEVMLSDELAEFEQVVKDAIGTISISQGMFDALVSIVYNVGPGSSSKDGIIRLKSGKKSTLLSKVIAGDKDGAAAEFLKWTRAGGVVLNGLVKRRKAEHDLFMSES